MKRLVVLAAALAALPGCKIVSAAATGMANGVNQIVAKPCENGVGGSLQGSCAGMKQAAENDPAQACTLFTPLEGYYIGRSATATVLATKFDNHVIWLDGQGAKARPTVALRYLDDLASVIIAAAERTRKKGAAERDPGTFRVAVVDSDAPNAWSTPGGFTVITTAMLRLAHSEDEVAAILAHEMGHVVLCHGLKAIVADRRRAGYRQAVESAAEASDLSFFAHALGDFTDSVVTAMDRGYEPDWELDADARAVRILEAAGYDPNALKTVIARLQTWHTAHKSEKSMADTHPPATEREKAIGNPPSPQVSKRAEAVRARRFHRDLQVPLAKLAGDKATARR